MQNSDLVELFNSLTTNELKRFSAFMDSPYSDHGRYRKEVQNLYKVLLNFAQTKNIDLLHREKVLKQVFVKGTPAHKLERVMFEFSLLIREFLLLEDYIDDSQKTAQQLDYVRILRSKGLIGKASITLKQTFDAINKVPIKSSKDYSLAFEASSTAYSFASSQHNTWKDDLNIFNTLHYLDLYYWSNKMQMINHYLMITKLSKLNVDSSKINIDGGSFFKSLRVEDAPTLFISYKIYLLLMDEKPSNEGFEELRQLLNEYENQMDRESIALFYSYLRNYCTHLYFYGHLKLIFELHQIQKDNLEKGYFYYEENKIHSSSYHSIATTALKAKSYDWALQFIERYKDNILDNDAAEEAYHLNMSDYHFHIGDYDSALRLLPLSSTDLDRHLRARRLEIKIYYEMNSDLLIYKIEAFKVYIHRASQKLISESNRERHNNFVNLMLQLAQLPLLDKSKAGRILARIEEKAHVVEKEWLLEKAGQLADKVR